MNRTCSVCDNCECVRIGSVGNYSLMECNKCKLQFLDPVPNMESLNKIYSDYFEPWDLKNFQKEVSSMKSATFKGYLKQFDNHASSTKLLDVGCATGELMKTAKEIGFDVYGVEVSPYGIACCKDQFGENKIIGRKLKADDFPPDFFEVITLSDVLEHIVDPQPFLDILWRFLKKDGLLMVVTPDTSSISRRLMGMHWMHYKEEHVFYYNHLNIVKLFSSKFKVLTIRNAYKSLTINYCVNILSRYTLHRCKWLFTAVIKLLPLRIRHYPFRVNIGEMFILCRKVSMVNVNKQ